MTLLEPSLVILLVVLSMPHQAGVAPAPPSGVTRQRPVIRLASLPGARPLIPRGVQRGVVAPLYNPRLHCPRRRAGLHVGLAALDPGDLFGQKGL